MEQKLVFPFLLVGHNALSLTIKSLRKIRWDTTWTYWSIELSHHGGRGKYHHNGGLCIGRTATSIQSNPMILPPHSSRAHTHTHTHTHNLLHIFSLKSETIFDRLKMENENATDSRNS
jgi:hypothetical protein